MSLTITRPTLTLRELRLQIAMTERELGSAAGVSSATVCLIETARTNPLPSTRRAIAAALGVSPSVVVWPARRPIPEKLG